jgi:Tfp pilus assembly protein FimT
MIEIALLTKKVHWKRNVFSLVELLAVIAVRGFLTTLSSTGFASLMMSNHLNEATSGVQRQLELARQAAKTLNGFSFNLKLTAPSDSISTDLMTWATTPSNVTSISQIDLTLNGASMGLSIPDLSIVSNGSKDVLEFDVAAVPEPSTWALFAVRVWAFSSSPRANGCV